MKQRVSKGDKLIEADHRRRLHVFC